MPPAPPAVPLVVCGLKSKGQHQHRTGGQDETEDVLGLLSRKPKQRTNATSHTTGANIVDLHHIVASTFLAIAALFALGLEL